VTGVGTGVGSAGANTGAAGLTAGPLEAMVTSSVCPAPGTTVMQFHWAYARRSRLNPQMYSSDWHRAMNVRRLPTFACPETAPTFGSRNGLTSSSKVSRAKCVSASRNTNVL